MLDRRVRRREEPLAAAQIYLERLAAEHRCRALVLATEDGAPLAGVGSEEELAEVSTGGRVRFEVGAGYVVAATSRVPEAACAETLARILAV